MFAAMTSGSTHTDSTKKVFSPNGSHMHRREEEGRCMKTPLDANTHEQHVTHFHAKAFFPSIYSESFSRPSHQKFLAHHSMTHHALYSFPQQCLQVENSCSTQNVGWKRKKQMQRAQVQPHKQLTNISEITF